MAHGTVVLAGGLPVERLALDLLIADFGWSFEEADSLSCLAELNSRRNVVAVLFSPRNLELPWDEALSGVLKAAPGAMPILCHGFADMIDWPQAAEAGAFHSLRLPFDLREVRQSLGFVWAAKRHPGIVPIHRRLQRRRGVTKPTSEACAQAAGIVA